MYSDSQTALTGYFEKAAREGSLRQSYVIYGEEGMGKSYALSKIKEYIICDTNTACGKCPGCLSLSKNANPDCVTVDRGDKKTIELKKIRDLIKEAYIKPVGGRYKLFVIEDAAFMDTAPQNALLKLIEEPPAFAVFIFVTDNLNSILPTILSRSLKLNLESWSYADLKKACPLCDEDSFMYTYCLGNIGRLKHLSGDDEFKALRQKVIASFISMVSGEAAALYDSVALWTSNKDNKERLISILSMFIRDVVFFKSGNTEQIANKDKIKDIQEVSDRLSLKSAFKMLELVGEAPRLMGRYGNFNMLAETLMIRLGEEIND